MELLVENVVEERELLPYELERDKHIDNDITYWNDFLAQRPCPLKGRGR